MPRMIFVNLPVTDVPASKAFHEALGFHNNPNFSDESGVCMVWSDTIFVMALSHEKWTMFTSQPIPSRDSSEVMNCLSCEDRDEVNRLADAAGKHGGTADINPAQDHGFMMSRSFADPDGHVWEVMWMDPAAVPPEE